MKLKKNSFMQGAFVATLGIVITKIIGILYVIPFYSIIGEQGGALYGYAYNIYSIFLGISTAGIPLAISKITSEYSTLGYYEEKERAFKLSRMFLTSVGIICFLLLFIFAKDISYMIIGNITGGNTREDVTFVIRTISTAILIIPTVSVYRGYFQGHKFITPTSISQVLEQIFRVTIIIGGGYILKYVFHLNTRDIVGVAVFAATIGGLVSYLYLRIKMSKNKSLFIEKSESKEKKVRVTDKEIIKKVFVYAIPFIMIDLFKSLYNSVDIMMLVKQLVNNYGYTVKDAESIMSVISVWGNKLNMMVSAGFTGITTSLIPSLTSSFVKKDKEAVNNKINQAYKLTTYVVIPMVIGLSFLSSPVWNIFYGNSNFGPLVYKYFVFVALFSGLFSTTIIIIQVLKEYKTVFISLIAGILTKIILNIPMLYLFKKIGLPVFYGAITASIIGYLLGMFISIYVMKKKYSINFKEFLQELIHILIGIICMLIVLCLIKLFIPIVPYGRFKAILVTIVYALLGAGTYFGVTYKLGSIKNIFGVDSISKAIKKFRR